MTYKLVKAYFLESDERLSAWLLLLGAVIGMIGLVAIMALLTTWNLDFMTALTDMNVPVFIESIKTFALLVTGYLAIDVAKTNMIGVLAIRWRNWLTRDLLDKYLGPDANNYLELSRNLPLNFKIDNPAQRIQDDILLFTKQTLTLTLDFIQNILIQATFIGTLWVIGGPLSFALWGVSITIPGYLVWTAFLFSAVTNVLTHWIGRALSKLSHDLQGLEAEFRKEMELISHDAESIAQDRGETYYKKSLLKKFQAICIKSYDILRVQMNLTAFKSIFSQITMLVPYVTAAPLYFAKKISYAGLMQVGWAFQQIQMSLSWFSNSYEMLANYHASVARVAALENALKTKSAAMKASPAIKIAEKHTNELTVRNLDIAYPGGTTSMLRGLSLTFRPHENTVIKGPSGLGKSTLFKAIAGTWTYGKGNVQISNRNKMCFLPQRPSLPNDTLRAVLAYPEPETTYTDAQYIRVLHNVGNMNQFIAQLDTKKNWSGTFSPGQQERIAFARALLKKPDWLFLDEATASLDTQGERRMYNLVKRKLPNTTVISIAHRPSVTQFHQRVIKIQGADENGKVKLRDSKKRHGNSGDRQLVRRVGL